MAEAEATNQDAKPVNPEVPPRLDLSAERKRRSAEQVSQREWLERRQAERQTAAVEQQAQPEAPTPDPQPEPTTELTPEGSEGSEADAQTTEAAEVAPEAAAAESEADEAYFPESLGEFAEALGVDPKDFMQGVTTTVKVNGVEHTVPLEDLAKSYSSQEERGRVSNELAEQQRAFQAQVEQHQAEYQTRIQQADAMLDTLKTSIDSGPDEATLSQMLNSGQIDERQYLTARANRDAQSAAFNKAVENRNALAREANEKLQAAYQEERGREQENLLNFKPELRDPAKLSEYESRLRHNLTQNYGYTDERVNSFFQGYTLPDIKVLEDALAYRALKSKEKPLRQKLHTLPKLQKPGTKRTGAQQANDAVLGARSRLKASGSPKDAVALLRANRARRNQSHGGSQ